MKSLTCKQCNEFFDVSSKKEKFPIVTRCGILLCLSCWKKEDVKEGKVTKCFGKCVDHDWKNSSPVYTLLGCLETILLTANGFESFAKNPLGYRKMIFKHLECGICHEEYSSLESDLYPHILDCGHAYCMGCCEKLTKKASPIGRLFNFADTKTANLQACNIDSFEFTCNEKLFLYSLQITNKNVSAKSKIALTISSEDTVLRKIVVILPGPGTFSFPMIVPLEILPENNYLVDFSAPNLENGNRNVVMQGPGEVSQTIDGTEYKAKFSNYARNQNYSNHYNSSWSLPVLIVAKQPHYFQFSTSPSAAIHNLELIMDKCILPKDYDPRSIPIFCPLCSTASNFVAETSLKKNCIQEFMTEYEDLLKKATMLSCSCRKMMKIDDLLTCNTCKNEESEPVILCPKCLIIDHNGHHFEPASKQKILNLNHQMNEFLQTQLRTYEMMIPTMGEKITELLAMIPEKCTDFEEQMKNNDSYIVAFEKVAECKEIVKNYESICEDFIPHLRLLEKKLEELSVNVDKLKTTAISN